MTYPRYKIINLETTQYYHCVSRCVRRSFLCGKDKYTGRDFEHRRGWVEQRLLLLSEVFNIDIFAYAVMHNHTHLLLHVDIESNTLMSDLEVLHRWSRVRKLDAICCKYLLPSLRDELNEFELEYIKSVIKKIRDRLKNISWFMSLLNNYIARRANKEDECTGRFWEGRFKSQALLTKRAVLACMSYVDLNPIRAGISNCLLNSHYTSIQRRLRRSERSKQTLLLPVNQMSYRTKEDYLSKLKLSDYESHLESVLNFRRLPGKRCNLYSGLENQPIWIKRAQNFESEFPYMAGDAANMLVFRRQVNHSNYALRH
jgi:REP element-mobilizing transposase RayT